jgi:hypothetical protein
MGGHWAPRQVTGSVLVRQSCALTTYCPVVQ